MNPKGILCYTSKRLGKLIRWIAVNRSALGNTRDYLGRDGNKLETIAVRVESSMDHKAAGMPYSLTSMGETMR